MKRYSLPFFLALGATFGAYSCSSSGDSSGDTSGDDDGSHIVSHAGTAGSSGQAGSAGHAGSSGAHAGGSAAHSGGPGLGVGAGGMNTTGLVAICTPMTLTVGPAIPTATCKATFNGAAVTPVWSIDRGEIGSIDKTSGVFTPTASVGGVVTATAGYGMSSATAAINVSVHVTQTGPGKDDNVGTMTAGGVGGVGGEGVGPVPGAAVKAALAGAATATGAPTWLYPYDKTVWPRGLLPPLLQWAPSAAGPQTFDGVLIHMETMSKSFVYDGTFGIPTGATNLIHHPIPIDAWTAATESASGTDTLSVSLTVSSAGKAYGPITETWTVAPGRLGGTVYYNAYNTSLAKNYPGGMNDGGAFGAAVLSIAVGDAATGPTLVAGSTNPADPTDTTKCRTCHSVAAGGSRLIVQHGDNYAVTSAYELSSGNTEVPLAQPNIFGWAALYPDGSFALTNEGPLSAGVNVGAGLYSLPDGNPIAAPGLTTIAPNVATPSFSVDGKHVAFNVMITDPMTGMPAPGPQLGTTDFDVSTKTFSNPQVVDDDTGDAAGNFPSWPAFFPSDDSLVFQNSPGMGTGSLSQVMWSDLATGKSALLGHLNGLGDDGKPSIPSNSDHPDDTQRNYEPTVGPLSTGGYAWVIFTSRRLYGNIATLPPGASDPRNFDLVTGVSPKKLWVAAVDLGAAPGTDPSHPAFYLPAQELHGSNSRGFWVFGPCRPDGSTCSTGDQCCGGYCQPDGTNGALICSNMKPSCAAEQESCKTASDCCNASDMCLNGFCAQKPSGPHG